MKEKHKIAKKNIIIITSIILLVLVLIIGIAYAAFDFNFIGNTNTLETGEVSLELLESNNNIITINNALPMSDNEGKGQSKTFDFQVETKASRDLDMEYYLYIEPLDVKCSDLKNPNTKDNPYCYDYALTEEEETAVINFIASTSGSNLSVEEATNFYNLLLEEDDEGMTDFYVNNFDAPSDVAKRIIKEIASMGYEKFFYGLYEQEGNTLTKAFYGNLKALQNNLLSNQIKIYLTDYNDNQLVSPQKISSLAVPDGKYLLYSDINYHSRENNIYQDKYKIKVWIDSDVDASTWDEKTNLLYKFRIGVTTSKPDLASMMIDGPTFNKQISPYKGKIRKVEFKPNTSDIDTSNALKTFDFSSNSDGSITGILKDSSLATRSVDTYYDLYIVSPNKILANYDSSSMFYGFYSLQEINPNMLDVSHVYNMNEMFLTNSSYDLYFDVSAWNTLNVKSYKCAFGPIGLAQITTGEGWTIPFDKDLSCRPN